ncbi:putative membrane protein [Vibrio campbellii]|nr:putative membrane protein [Vibrio campbellii]
MIAFSLNKIDILGAILIITASLLILALFIYGLKDGYNRAG